MRVLTIHNGTGSRYYRIIPQLKALQQRGYKTYLIDHNNEHIKQYIDNSDIVIFQMVFSKEWVDYVKKQNKKVIFECDDLIHKVPKGHYSYNETKGILNQIKWWWRIWQVLRRCDGFITTTEKLNDIYGWIVKQRLVYKNDCDLVHWLKEYKENTTDRIRILWAGSTSHSPDLEMIKPVLKEILIKYPQSQFIYVGHGGIKSQDLQAKFIYGDDLFEGLPENREAMLSIPANVFPYILSTLQADIGIAPLMKNVFNDCKSQCKYLEYGINRIPAVYSAHHYKDVQHNKTGFLAETKEDWIKYLTMLIEDIKLRKQIGENAYQDVLNNYDNRKFVNEWINFIDKIYQK